MARNLDENVSLGRDRMLMEENIVIRKAKLKDAESIADFNINMAKETESKNLDKDVVLKGVKAVIRDPHKGFYLVAEKKMAPQRLSVNY